MSKFKTGDIVFDDPYYRYVYALRNENYLISSIGFFLLDEIQIEYLERYVSLATEVFRDG